MELEEGEKEAGEDGEKVEPPGERKSLLELASECGRSGCVKVLLEAGLSPDRHLNSRKDNLSGLQLATKNGHNG